jgi:hypothetical protein
MSRLPDLSALGNRPAPVGRQAIAQQDTTSTGRALANLGVEISHVSEEIQKRDDEQKVLEYRRKLIDFDKTKVHDPEKGAVSKLGKDAFDLPTTLPAEFDEYAGKAAEGLTSNRQRQIAKDMALGRRESLVTWASGHALKPSKPSRIRPRSIRRKPPPN